MLMAEELLGDHLDSPPTLRGEYLHRMDGESTEKHLERITGWFSESIESGIPVLFYIRRYERTSDGRQPRMVFGHHVVFTSLEGEISKTDRGVLRVHLRRLVVGSSRSRRSDRCGAGVHGADLHIPIRWGSSLDDREAPHGTSAVGSPRALLRIESFSRERDHGRSLRDVRRRRQLTSI